MNKLDRLSALLSRFKLSVTVSAPEDAMLQLSRDASSKGWRLVLAPHGPCPMQRAPANPAFSARFSWGGDGNPLWAALPSCIERDIPPGDGLEMLAELLAAETTESRCGAAAVVNRLGEVLIVRILREELARGGAQTGPLAALADPRLARAVVAMHEDPGREWRNEDLADIAGLSRSRFAQLFTAAVGEGPSAYLRRWRLSLARQDLARGDRVQAVARRYGYKSGEALNRAFHRAFAISPSDLRAGSTSASSQSASDALVLEDPS